MCFLPSCWLLHCCRLVCKRMVLCVVLLAEQENFVADAAAEELRDRLRQLARQVVDLQVGSLTTTLSSPSAAVGFV